MRRVATLAGLAGCLLASTARADDPKSPPGAHATPAEKPKECVAFARTWGDAVEEARAMSAPVLVHCLDFDASATWGYQSGVLCNKKYMECAASNTVDVMGMINIEKAVARRDKRAQTYDATVDGATVKFLVEFPGVTVEDVVAMTTATAKYDTTGYAPFTALVDPWTEESLQHWSGHQSAHSLIDAVTEIRKRMEKDHGKGASRKDARTFLAARALATAKTSKGEFAAALDALGELSPAAEKGPEGLKRLLADARAAAVKAAEKALSAVEQDQAANPAAAKQRLLDLLPRLKGTGLESRAKELLQKMG